MQTPVTYRQIIELLLTLPPDKLASVYDYSLFLRSQSTAPVEEYKPLSDDDLTAIAAMTFADLDAQESLHEDKESYGS
jgi:hypothetical protein